MYFVSPQHAFNYRMSRRRFEQVNKAQSYLLSEPKIYQVLAYSRNLESDARALIEDESVKHIIAASYCLANETRKFDLIGAITTWDERHFLAFVQSLEIWREEHAQ